MVYKFFGKKTGFWATRKVGTDVNEVLAQESRKPVIKNFKRREVYARFKDNIWAVDLAEIGSLWNTYVSLMFSSNMPGWNLWRTKKLKQFLRFHTNSKRIST